MISAFLSLPLRPPAALIRCLLIALALLLLGTSVAEGQIIRASNTFYARLGAGTSVSETDAATYAVEPYSFNGEIGYQMTRSLGVGAGLTFADYPKATDINTQMTTVQGVLRWTLFPQHAATPYFNVGPHVTLGGDNPAAGAIFGLGVDYVFTRRTSVFLDATAYATFPDDAIDSRDDGRATFDGLGFWGAGVRSSLSAAPTPVRLHPIERPATVYRGEPVRFTVRAHDDTSLPVQYAWRMGDGTETDGVVAEHTYRLEGRYPVTVTAENDGGRDVETIYVNVVERAVPPRITALAADTIRAFTHQLIRFSAALEGSAPLDAVWRFGDGTPAVVERGAHRYDRDQYIGQVATDIRQGYVFERPGTYTVTLNAENRFGNDVQEITIDVQPGAARLLTALESDPCFQETPVDTVYFAFDRATLNDRSIARLEATAERLKECPNQLVRLDGYADWVGASTYNAALSHRRAAAVQAVYEDAGIDPDRIVMRGYGELSPPCPPGGSATEDLGCRSFRRVESIIVMDEQPLATRAVQMTSGTLQQPAHAAPARAETGEWVISVAWYGDAEEALRHAEQVRSATADLDAPRVHVVPADTREPGFRVVLGPLRTVVEARNRKRSLGTTLPADAWVYRLTEPLDSTMIATDGAPGYDR